MRQIESLINAARSTGCKSTAEGYLKKVINLAEKFNFYVKYYTHMYIDKYITSM